MRQDGCDSFAFTENYFAPPNLHLVSGLSLTRPSCISVVDSKEGPHPRLTPLEMVSTWSIEQVPQTVSAGFHKSR